MKASKEAPIYAQKQPVGQRIRNIVSRQWQYHILLIPGIILLIIFKATPHNRRIKCSASLELPTFR